MVSIAGARVLLIHSDTVWFLACAACEIFSKSPALNLTGTMRVFWCASDILSRRIFLRSGFELGISEILDNRRSDC